ncbi:GNAT family N-acetyltransferase [Treponema pectinovorum]|uniref:GNAT family N-acetyltransferase n=1 Tax=Treponema pectinovorum TaxID=164 RepID=UPI0011C8CE7C|nr:GNAT family N-acetyltransferase [Treponema pectinovorum]
MIEVKFEALKNKSAAYDAQTEIGYCSFIADGDIWTVNHTVVDEKYGGQGIAKRLLTCVVENAKSQGKKIKPVCSYVVREFEKHPELYKEVAI